MCKRSTTKPSRMVVATSKRVARQKDVAAEHADPTDDDVVAHANSHADAHGNKTQQQPRRSKERTLRRAKELANVAKASKNPDKQGAENSTAPRKTDTAKTDTDNTGDDLSPTVIDKFYAPTQWDWLYGGEDSVSARHDALFVLDVSGTIGEEYRPLFFDIARMVCIHATIQLMAYIGGSVPSFFTSEFAEMLLYIIIGTMLFWLVLRKLVWLA